MKICIRKPKKLQAQFFLISPRLVFDSDHNNFRFWDCLRSKWPKIIDPVNNPRHDLENLEKSALNTNVKECMMFFANYFFHKFGCEICFVSTVITVWIRQDFWGSFYAVFLLILMIISFQSRTHLKRVWKTYTMMLSIIWAIQVRFNRLPDFSHLIG